MWDLVRFSPAAGPGEGAEFPQYINVKSAPANFFASVSNLEAARSAAKRCPYLHFSTYEADIGLVRAIAENEGTLVVAVSDFLDANAQQVAQRLGRARQLV